MVTRVHSDTGAPEALAAAMPPGTWPGAETTAADSPQAAAKVVDPTPNGAWKTWRVATGAAAGARRQAKLDAR